MPVRDRELKLVVVTGEHSGDELGAKLMDAVAERHAGPIRWTGVGGEAMAARGLESLFPLSDVAVMGPMSILPKLPRIVRRVYAAVDAAVAAEPDAVVIIDAPEFTHPIAKRIRKRRPRIPIVDYVSPTVWAWRPGRARKMRAYVDHLLALLPFEPEVHTRLGGPPCTYIGHPLADRVAAWRAIDPAPLAHRLSLDPAKPVLLVLPGSRTSEVTRLMQPFGATVAMLVASGITPQVIIPAVPHVRTLIQQQLGRWPLAAHVVSGEADKLMAFRLARAALAASGTVTLELAAAGTPMVVAYRVDGVASHLRFLVKTPSIVLANLVLGENAFPEFIQEQCVAEHMAPALASILAAGEARNRQLAALARIPDRLAVPHGSPSGMAADIVLALAARGRTA